MIESSHGGEIWPRLSQSAVGTMVEFKDPNSPVGEGFDNRVFIIPAIIIVSLVGKFDESFSDPDVLSIEWVVPAGTTCY